VDAPLPAPDALVRPWRTATLVASLVAAIELVLLIGASVLLLAKPLAHMMKRHAETAAFAPAKHHAAAVPVRHVRVKTPAAKLPRIRTGVLVLNGNGRAGAASAEAARLHGLGYVIRAKGNARRQDYATTVVMYRKGYAGEAARLARDLHVKIVGPLDGLAPSALHGGQLAVVLGAA
jgi:LytR cell envelope-related transcriptional attenuator